MRITYIAHTRFPTEKAHGHQVAQVCHALSELGHEVTLLTPTVWNPIQMKAHEYYGLPESFTIVRLEHWDPWKSRLVAGFLKFAVSMMFYGRAVKRYVRQHSADLLYVRSPLLLRFLPTRRVPVILELHTLPQRGRRTFVRLCNRCTKVVCLTSVMRDELLKLGVHSDRVIVEGDGVDLARFTSAPSVEEAKEKWKLPCDVPVIGYVGSLVTQDTIEKGVRELLDAFVILKAKGELFYGWIVGGPRNLMEEYQAYAKQKGLGALVSFAGPIPAAGVPSSIAAADICVYPAPRSNHSYFQRDTSPLKIFEYMAAKKPIVAAALPPVRDVLDDTFVKFFEPGDAESLAKALHWMMSHPDEAKAMGEMGYDIVKKHSWKERMKRVLRHAIEN